MNLPTLETPQFLKDLFFSTEGDQSKGNQSHKERRAPGKGHPSGDDATIAALVAATMSSPLDSAEDMKDLPMDLWQNGLMHLTKKLIEIRTTLLSIDQSDVLKLPLLSSVARVPVKVPRP